MRVAATLGCTVAELGERMTAEELGWWIAYLDTQPYGSQAIELAVAQVLSALYNGARQRKDKRTWSPADFLVDDPWKPPRKKSRIPTMSQIKAFFGHR